MEGVGDEGQIREEVAEQVMTEMRRHFRPEFLNRVDDTVLFKPLSLTEIEQIVDLMTQELRQRLHERRIELTTTEPARAFIAREGFDPVFGARPLKRYIQHELETRIGRALIAGEIADGSEVAVGLSDGQLQIETRPAPTRDAEGETRPASAAA
jgi:ATP-dependent Clp protease ATP-binding subunit ClpB